MGKNVQHVQHVKSNVVENGSPKLPTPSVLAEGEIAINFAEGYETLSIKSSSGNIKTFSSDEYYTEKKLGSGFTSANSGRTVTDVIVENEEIISSALTDLDDRKLDASAYTPTDLSNYYTKDETSGATELSSEFALYYKKTETSGSTELTNAFNEKVNVADVVSAITSANSASTNPVSVKVVAENELTVSNALIDLDERKLDASAYTPTDLSNYYTKEEIDEQQEVVTAALNDLESRKANETDLEEIGEATAYALNDLECRKADKDEFDDQFEVITASLNDLENRKLDVSSISGKVNTSDIVSAITPSNSGSTAPIATKVVAENELTVSNALIDLDERKLDASAYTPTDLSDYYTKSETSGATELSTALGNKLNTSDFNTYSGSVDTALSGKIDTNDVDQTIDSTTSASTNPVATSAVYDFLTAYTPSITVDQVLDNTTSASTNAVSTSAVYRCINDNELVVSTAVNNLEENKADREEDLDGIKLKKITQSDYDALVQAGTVDPNTLYIITD